MKNQDLQELNKLKEKVKEYINHLENPKQIIGYNDLRLKLKKELKEMVGIK